MEQIVDTALFGSNKELTFTSSPLCVRFLDGVVCREAAHELVEGAETIGYTSGNGDDVDNTTAVVMVWRVPEIPHS